MVYGQTEVTRDLMEARAAQGLRPSTRRERAPAGFDGARRAALQRATQAARDRGRLHRRLRRLPRRGRASVPASALQTYEKVYPFGWLGVLADVPPVHARADLRQPPTRLRAVQHAQQDRVRYYVQCSLDDQWRTGATSASAPS
jgi:p-hydroxybenzoate 3-monooxygenase